MSINTSLQGASDNAGVREEDRYKGVGVSRQLLIMVFKKKCTTDMPSVLYPLERINRDAVGRAVLHVNEFDLIL